MTTSTANQNHRRCPVCRQPVCRDLAGQGFSRHRCCANYRWLMQRTANLPEADRSYACATGRCPYERGQRD